MITLARGGFRVTVGDDVSRAVALRNLVFRGGTGAQDGDAFDARCRHLVVEHPASGQPVACCRVQTFASGADIHRSYAAQYYDLERLSGWPSPMLEIGRFCLHPDWHDPDILRLAWAALTAIVDQAGISLLFGCTSFAGTDPQAHTGALAHLAQSHLAPDALRPLRKIGAGLSTASLHLLRPDPAVGMAAMPALLRSYLGMGGWVSDHAVIDRDLGTLHVFTGLEVAAIPAARQRALRLLGAPMPS